MRLLRGSLPQNLDYGFGYGSDYGSDYGYGFGYGSGYGSGFGSGFGFGFGYGDGSGSGSGDGDSNGDDIVPKRILKVQSFSVGDYVRIIKTPDPWEGSGEENPESYIGHVGLVVEVSGIGDPDLGGGLALLRFPVLYKENKTGQRNIEFESLELVSRPAYELPRHCTEE